MSNIRSDARRLRCSRIPLGIAHYGEEPLELRPRRKLLRTRNAHCTDAPRRTRKRARSATERTHTHASSNTCTSTPTRPCIYTPTWETNITQPHITTHNVAIERTREHKHEKNNAHRDAYTLTHMRNMKIQIREDVQAFDAQARKLMGNDEG